MRVLHSVATYLNISENWIYPQIVQVPGVESRVLCSSTTNLDCFPIRGSKLIIDPPPWNRSFGIPRLLNALGRRLGCGGLLRQLKIRAWQPQIIHAHFGTRGWEALTLKKLLCIPLVTSFYGYDAWLLPEAEPSWRERYRDLFKHGDVFLVEGPAMRQRLRGIDCPEEKISVQRIGVDLDSLPFEEKHFSGDLKIIMVGRFVEKKGFVDGLRACVLARSKGVNLTISIIGDASAGDSEGQRIKRELQTLASCPELDNRVQFTGFIPLQKTRELLKTHNVFLCPSKHAASGDAEGGSPVVLTEAMAFGLLCIGTRHCDIPEVVVDGKTGYLSNESDVIGMSEILCSIGNGSNRLLELTKQGRKHVEQNFSAPIQSQKLRAIYQSLLSPAVCRC